MRFQPRASRPSRQAFVVRVWWEEDDTGAPTQLRGIIQEVHSREEAPFASLQELNMWLASRLRPPGAPR
jgi:hypothetical protein